MYRSLFSLLLLLVLFACSDIPRDNILDPKNPAGYSSPVVLVEAFVNTSDEIPTAYNRWAVQALSNIDNLFGQEVIIVEYHRGALAYYDPYADSTKHSITDLHREYTELAEIPMGVPDIFINGAGQRVSGAASVQSVSQMVQDKITEQLESKNYLRLEADLEWDGTRLISDCRIAALGNKTFNNPKLRLITLNTYPADPYGQRVVSELLKGEFLPDLKDGRVVEQSIGPLNLKIKPDAVVLAVISEDGKTVIQSLRKEL